MPDIQPHSFGWPLALKVLVLIGLLIAVEYFFGWQMLLQPWLELSMPAVVFAVLLMFLSYAARACRVMAYFWKPLSGCFLTVLRLMLLHNLWNNLLPARTGEVAFPVLMRRYFSIPLSASAPALLWFRLLDLLTLSAVGLAAIALSNGNIGLAVIVVLACFLAVPSCYKLLPWLLKTLQKYLPESAQPLLLKVEIALPNSWVVMFYSLGWTLVTWGLKLWAFSWVLQNFVGIGLGGALLGSIGGELTSVLPVHGIAGAGTYEAGVTAALAPFGIPPVAAIQGAINLHLFLLSCTLLGGLFSMLLPLKQAKESL